MFVRHYRSKISKYLIFSPPSPPALATEYNSFQAPYTKSMTWSSSWKVAVELPACGPDGGQSSHTRSLIKNWSAVLQPKQHLNALYPPVLQGTMEQTKHLCSRHPFSPWPGEQLLRNKGQVNQLLFACVPCVNTSCPADRNNNEKESFWKVPK